MKSLPGIAMDLASLLILFPSQLLWAQIPVVGVPVPELMVLDSEMKTFMETNEITAGSLSVMRNGTIVFHHTYGWQDLEQQKPIRPDALFRVASITKPFTAAAIRNLIEDGLLSLDTKVFSLGTPGVGILDYVPFGTPDARLGDITIDHLLRHYGGWDRGVAGDLTYMDRAIAAAMDVPSPPGRENTVRYIMGQPLQNEPGSTYAYSNIGYLLLGLIVEEVSGTDYRSFLQNNIMGPEGSDGNDWLLGRTFASEQDAREPFYDYQFNANNVFYPALSDDAFVNWPYGGFDFEARTGQGRIVAHGYVLLRQLHRYQIAGADIGGPRPSPGGWRWNHTGSLTGTNALARQRGDGINYAVMFNKRPSSGSYSSTMRSSLDAIFDSGTITWPTTDITQLLPPVPDVEFTVLPHTLGAVTEAGRHYQWQQSEDMFEWGDCMEPFVGDGSLIERVAPLTSADSEFFRLTVRQ
ncbi:MAG: serine hydrolase domain-containing protein [Roseibacillus sp.]